MKGASLRLVLTLVVVILLAGCEAFGARKSSRRRRVWNNEVSIELKPKRTLSRLPPQGLEDDTEFSAAALDDPDSPLSVRVIYFDYDSSCIHTRGIPRHHRGSCVVSGFELRDQRDLGRSRG